MRKVTFLIAVCVVLAVMVATIAGQAPRAPVRAVAAAEVVDEVVAVEHLLRQVLPRLAKMALRTCRESCSGLQRQIAEWARK